MDKKEIFEILNSNLSFYLATAEGNQPRVRAMMLYKADENGIVFHTSSIKDVRAQIQSNPNAEMCFFDPNKGIQVRVSGKLEEITDTKYKDEILEHPTREFLRNMKARGVFKDFYEEIKVFSLKNGTAVAWTFDSNFAPKEKISL
ncbi:MAG: pyridoxamine 5'-phosphate oxidase family protein [Endomicrobia bacterium]|nr:pyridoxamine 5'-phosphate oxidase family protein [Endomicrobiia bacterium]